MPYHVAGVIAAVAFLFTVAGEIFQLRKVLRRRRDYLRQVPGAGRPTAILSLNQIVSVFLATYAFFLYAVSLRPVNHYLAWPRLMAALMAVVLLHQLYLDRRSRATALAFGGAVLALLAAPLVLLPGPWRTSGVLAAQLLVVTATVVLAQGYTHQVVLIRRSGRTGAVSLRFHQCVLLAGVTTVAFGLTMGWRQGWPLILLASVSATLKLITLWHFRWVRLSPEARRRREAADEGVG